MRLAPIRCAARCGYLHPVDSCALVRVGSVGEIDGDAPGPRDMGQQAGGELVAFRDTRRGQPAVRSRQAAGGRRQARFHVKRRIQFRYAPQAAFPRPSRSITAPSTPSTSAPSLRIHSPTPRARRSFDTARCSSFPRPFRAKVGQSGPISAYQGRADILKSTARAQANDPPARVRTRGRGPMTKSLLQVGRAPRLLVRRAGARANQRIRA